MATSAEMFKLKKIHLLPN